MPHPIYGPPSHDLESIRLTLHLGSLRNNHVTRLELQGSTSTKRGHLWYYRELWSPSDQSAGLQPVDTAHWALLAAAQDRPNTQEALERCLMPGGWEDVQLPM